MTRPFVLDSTQLCVHLSRLPLVASGRSLHRAALQALTRGRLEESRHNVAEGDLIPPLGKEGGHDPPDGSGADDRKPLRRVVSFFHRTRASYRH